MYTNTQIIVTFTHAFTLKYTHHHYNPHKHTHNHSYTQNKYTYSNKYTHNKNKIYTTNGLLSNLSVDIKINTIQKHTQISGAVSAFRQTIIIIALGVLKPTLPAAHCCHFAACVRPARCAAAKTNHPQSPIALRATTGAGAWGRARAHLFVALQLYIHYILDAAISPLSVHSRTHH